MTTPVNDDQLLALVAEVLAGDGPPPAALDAAYAAFGWRTLEADLAQLIDDTEPEVVGFDQWTAFARVVTLNTGYGSIEVSIDNDRLEVSVSPRPRRIVLRQPGSSAELTVDDDGRAAAEGIAGPVRFEVAWPAGAALTPWFTV